MHFDHSLWVVLRSRSVLPRGRMPCQRCVPIWNRDGSLPGAQRCRLLHTFA